MSELTRYKMKFVILRNDDGDDYVDIGPLESRDGPWCLTRDALAIIEAQAAKIRDLEHELDILRDDLENLAEERKGQLMFEPE